MDSTHLPQQTIDEIVGGRVATDEEVRHIAACEDCCDYYLLKRKELRLYAPDHNLQAQLQAHESF